MAAQQPNFNTLSQNLIDASAEISLVPNMPAIAVQQQLGQILQGLDRMGQQLNTLQAGYETF